MHRPNVVQVLGVYYPTPKANLPWLVMEMMDTSLKEFLDVILVDSSQSLYMHGQDIIYRDLSSNNILLLTKI